MTEERRVAPEVQQLFQTGLDLNHRELFQKGDVKQWFTQPRVTVPLFFGGVLRGWQKRQMAASQYGPKYIGSKGYPRARTLFGLDAVDDGQPLIVVESPLSVLRLHTEGFPNCVSTQGSAITADQINLMRQFQDVYIFPDADADGLRFTWSIVEGLARASNVWVVPNEQAGTDPADYDAPAIAQMIEGAEPSVLWEINA